MPRNSQQERHWLSMEVTSQDEQKNFTRRNSEKGKHENQIVSSRTAGQCGFGRAGPSWRRVSWRRRWRRRTFRHGWRRSCAKRGGSVVLRNVGRRVWWGGVSPGWGGRV